MKTCEICHFCVDREGDNALLLVPYNFEEEFIIHRGQDRKYIHTACLE